MEMHRLLRERDEQLQYLQRMEVLGAMAGGVAHDFNNLLMAMMGNVSILLHERDRDNPEFMRLESIRQYIVSGSKLTKQLLGFAQGDTYSALPIDLNWIITDMIKMFGRTHKELKIKSFLEKNIWAVVADASQVEQVLMNLLVNASQALSGGGTIEILTRNIDISENQASLYLAASGRYVEIVVKDDGEGMAREVLDRIFEPFFSTRASESSSGLGLTAVYGIVKNHGGFINVSSEPGRGSSFFIYFPASNERARRLSRPTGEVIRGSETVLLVDDEEIILKTAGSMLAKLGYKVILAESGHEAVLRTKEMGDAIDLVIMDMIMPEMDGVATFREMRRIIPGMKVLLSSGYSFGEDAHKLMESGNVGYIQKPFDIKELSIKVRDVLDKVSRPSDS